MGAIVIAAHADSENRKRHELEEATRLQIFLDNSNFGPGKIDGRNGEFTRKAVALFKRSRGLPPSPVGDPKAPIDTTGLNLAAVDPVFVSYVVTKEDVQSAGELPEEPAAQAEMKWLPYRSVAEAVAEKFHCDIDFLREVNPKITGELKEGDQLIVPNVKPFELGALKGIKSGSETPVQLADHQGKPNPQDLPPGGSGATGKASEKETPPALSLYVSTREKMLEVYTAGQLIAAFPVTVGSQHTESPIGRWTVRGVTKLPNFRYDLKMLNDGERGSEFHILPPGPNNPAGVIWIELNKRGIGIHGASDPDLIGRDASHGCIRLANWDVVKLAQLVGIGVPVVVE